jgi:F-type H+-transporting ATPase subunit b
LDAARAEAAKVRSDAAVQAEETAKGIEAKANEEAKAIVAAAAQDAEEERNRILSELRGQVASIAIAAANKLVGEALDEKRQRAIISDFFAKVPAGLADFSGETAVVTSALELTAEEQANVTSALKGATVSFKVDPSILGGLIIRAGDQVVDNSVASQMAAMGESLK